MKTLLIVFSLLLVPLTLTSQVYDAANNPSGRNPVNVISDNIPTGNRVLPASTDEYGFSLGGNAFLGGLGATGGYLAVPDASGNYQLTSGGTIEAWIFPSATTSSAPAIVSKGDNTNVSFFFFWQSSTSLIGLRIGNSPVTNTGGTTVPMNQWSHVAVTWNGTAGNYTLNFYVNGAASGSSATSTGTFNSATSADSLIIGSSRSGFSGIAFYGYIDEVKIWNTVRTQTQIAQSRFIGLGDYTGTNTSGAITFASNYNGLLSSWTMNSHPRDDIGGQNGFTRNGGGFYWYGYTAGYPIPYNYALLCPFGANDFVTVPSNTAFNLSTAGTVEAWVYPLAQTTTHMIISRGTTGFDFFWGIRASASNKMAIDIGSGTQLVNTDGVTIPANKWTHVAARWTSSGGVYTVTYFVNGVQSGTPVTSTTTWTSTSGTLRIGGWHGGTANNFNGYIDEVRIWNSPRTDAQIKNAMIASCKALLPDATLIGAWNFDGNLKNFAATSGIDGSFSTTSPNNCRLSGYSNESTTGPIPDALFKTHGTVINTTAIPLGFVFRAPNLSIPDNSSITDTIKISGTPGTLTDIKVALSIQHQKTSDLTLKLKAPNGTEIILSAANGGTSANGYLTVLDDSASNAFSATNYLSPWSNYVKPQNTMGTFGNTPLNGNWVLTMTDGAASNTGTLLAWGLRFNGATIVGTGGFSTPVPDKFYLSQNYPNPFNPVTTIKYGIVKEAKVRLIIYDLLGREMKTLVNENKSPGEYAVSFSAQNLASGMYFYRLTAGNFTEVKKMMVIK
ncbi:MAG: T9SS type A sorting domain-containing protein [Bacteroidetes bacterium]|nr:T9SS type A sorting domain-containing protein [Bacteroidota bacterium]